MRYKSSSSFAYSMVILFRFFTSFVSYSVFCLSFSSFRYPSVDTGRMASLPGLGLIVFVGRIGFRGIGGFFGRINEMNRMRGKQRIETQVGSNSVALWPSTVVPL